MEKTTVQMVGACSPENLSGNSTDDLVKEGSRDIGGEAQLER